MVSLRCKMIVESEFEKIGIKCTVIELGRVKIPDTVTYTQLQDIGLALTCYGLELINNKKNILVERIKTVIIETIFFTEGPLKINFSDHLSSKLNFDYTYLANVFSNVQGITIKQFIILQKIQLVKQLIWQDELTLTQISWKLHYSSVAHLSTQFKKITGVTPSEFKLTTMHANIPQNVGIM